MQRSALSLCLLRGTTSEKEITMRRQTVRLVVLLALALLTVPLAADAQPAGKVWRTLLLDSRVVACEDVVY